jgi:hypothetical protein
MGHGDVGSVEGTSISGEANATKGQMERGRGAESVTTTYQRGALPSEKQADLPKPLGQKAVAKIAVAPQLRELLVSTVPKGSINDSSQTTPSIAH